jgi:type I restriction enzyme R subunit
VVERSGATESDVAEPTDPYDGEAAEAEGEGLEDAGARKFYVDDGKAYVVAEGIYLPDPATGRLRLVEYADHVADTVRRLYRTAGELRAVWRTQPGRTQVVEAFLARGIDFEEAADRLGLADLDPLDLLVHVAWNGEAITRRERARRFCSEQTRFLTSFAPEARAILDELLEKYVDHGISQLDDLRVLEVPPLDRHGGPVAVAERFGGPKELRQAIASMEELLYTA